MSRQMGTRRGFSRREFVKLAGFGSLSFAATICTPEKKQILHLGPGFPTATNQWPPDSGDSERLAIITSRKDSPPNGESVFSLTRESGNCIAVPP